MIKRLLHSLVETVIRNISGGLGNRIRVSYYSKRFKSCGKGIRIGIGVVFRGPEYMSFGDKVWIDDYCLLVAGDTALMEDREVIKINNPKFSGIEGEIHFGSFIHVAPYCLIHGFGGIVIKDLVSIASGAQIYSMSNHYQSKNNPEIIPYMNPMVDRSYVVFMKSPIVLEKNAFIGINSVILSGNIGENTMVAPLSLVKYNLPPNCLAGGNPAKRISDRKKQSNLIKNNITEAFEGTKRLVKGGLTLKKIVVLSNDTSHGRAMLKQIIGNKFDFSVTVAQLKLDNKKSILSTSQDIINSNGLNFFLKKAWRKLSSFRYYGEKFGFF